jgi:hypothetical protein
MFLFWPLSVSRLVELPSCDIRLWDDHDVRTDSEEPPVSRNLNLQLLTLDGIGEIISLSDQPFEFVAKFLFGFHGPLCVERWRPVRTRAPDEANKKESTDGSFNGSEEASTKAARIPPVE